MGEAGSKAFRETLKQAGAAKDRMGDLQMMVEAGHMEGKVKVFAGALQSTIGIIAGVEGAMNLMGVSADKAAEVTARLQSLMVMSQAIATIALLIFFMVSISPFLFLNPPQLLRKAGSERQRAEFRFSPFAFRFLKIPNPKSKIKNFLLFIFHLRSRRHHPNRFPLLVRVRAPVLPGRPRPVKPLARFHHQRVLPPSLVPAAAIISPRA